MISERKNADSSTSIITGWNASMDQTTEMELRSVNDPDDELLTAFLDDELSAEEKVNTQRRLTNEPQLAERLEKLRMAGKLVESLAMAPPDEHLTAATIETLTALVRREIQSAERRRFWRTFLFVLIFSLAGIAAFGLGSRFFSGFFSLGVRPQKADEPVIARLEALEIVGDFEFLNALLESGLFAKTAQTAPKTTDGKSSSASGDLSRQSDQTVTFLLSARFERMTREDKNSYRALYRQIDSAPNRDELFGLLERLERWFWFDLHENDRYGYWQLPQNERLAEIRRLIEHGPQTANRPNVPPEFRDGPDGSLDDPPIHAQGRSGGMQGRKTRDVKLSLPEELRQEDFGSVPLDIVLFVREKYQGKFSTDPKEQILFDFISTKGIDSFIALLSDAGKKYMEPLSDDQKTRLIGLLILADMHEKRVQMKFGGPPFDPNEPNREQARGKGDGERNENFRPPFDPPEDDGSASAGYYWKTESTKELAETLKKLPQAKRDELLSLPDDEMYSQLLVLHWGFDPKQVNPNQNAPQAGGPNFPPNNFSPSRHGSPRSKQEGRPQHREPFDSWNRLFDDNQAPNSAEPPAASSEPKE